MSRDLLVVVSLFMKLLHKPPTRVYTGISVFAANSPHYKPIEGFQRTIPSLAGPRAWHTFPS